MKTILEIFYLRIVGKRVRYQRKEVNLSRKGSDPDTLIWSHIRQEPRDSTAGECEFIVHSTSWRYERPAKVILTYAAYSDELTFEKGIAKSFALKNLPAVKKKTRKPSSQAELEKKVVSHALRHIAFLIKTDDQSNFKSAMLPETRATFESIWKSLAGKLF